VTTQGYAGLSKVSIQELVMQDVCCCQMPFLFPSLENESTKVSQHGRDIPHMCIGLSFKYKLNNRFFYL